MLHITTAAANIRHSHVMRANTPFLSCRNIRSLQNHFRTIFIPQNTRIHYGSFDGVTLSRVVVDEVSFRTLKFQPLLLFRRARIETVGTCSKSKITSNEHKYIRDMVQVNQFRGAKGSKPLPCDAKTGLLTQDKLVKRKKAVSTISSYRSITEALARSFGSDLKSAPRQHGLETRFIDRF